MPEKYRVVCVICDGEFGETENKDDAVIVCGACNTTIILSADKMAGINPNHLLRQSGGR